MLSQNQNEIQDTQRSFSTDIVEEWFEMPDDFLEPFFGIAENLVSIEEDIKEGLVRASNVGSCDDILNPGYIQSTPIAKTEESSENEWGLRLDKHKRSATSDSLSSNAKVGLTKELTLFWIQKTKQTADLVQF